MTKFRETLAESYLKRGVVHRASHQYCQGVKVDAMIRLCLEPPGPGRSVLHAPDTAERYVFEQQPLDLVHQMITAGTLDTHLMGEAVMLPSDNTWFEFVDPKELERVGVLLHRQASGKLLISLVLEMSGLPSPLMLLEVNDVPWRFKDQHPRNPSGELGEYCEVLWEVQPYEHARTSERAGTLLHDTLACLFLLCVPRICEVRTKTSKLEKERARQPKQHPAVEFKHVTMTIGVGSPRYLGGAARLAGETDEEHRTRLHRVTWHFRTYRYVKGSGGAVLRDKPLIRLIDEHWRGDASRGIVLHERTVKQKEEP